MRRYDVAHTTVATWRKVVSGDRPKHAHPRAWGLLRRCASGEQMDYSCTLALCIASSGRATSRSFFSWLFFLCLTFGFLCFQGGHDLLGVTPHYDLYNECALVFRFKGGFLDVGE